MSDLVAKTVPIDAVHVDPRNARKHGRRNLEAIAGSLAMFGQRRALIVMPDMTIIAGNGTLEAVRSLGWTEIVVTVVPEDWTPEQARAYALADNRTGELATSPGRRARRSRTRRPRPQRTRSPTLATSGSWGPTGSSAATPRTPIRSSASWTASVRSPC
jgi:hypothetical protein